MLDNKGLLRMTSRKQYSYHFANFANFMTGLPEEETDIESQINNISTGNPYRDENPTEQLRIIRIVHQEVDEDTQCYWGAKS